MFFNWTEWKDSFDEIAARETILQNVDLCLPTDLCLSKFLRYLAAGFQPIIFGCLIQISSCPFGLGKSEFIECFDQGPNH